MNHKIFRITSTLALTAALFSLATPFAQASGSPRLSGSYKIVAKRSPGSQTHVRLQIALSNPTSRDLRVEHLTLSGVSHPCRLVPQPVSLLVRARSSETTTRDFVLDRREFEHLRHAPHVPLLLTISTPGRHPFTEIVLLDRVSSKQGN
jgi:hypothetical protein